VYRWPVRVLSVSVIPEGQSEMPERRRAVRVPAQLALQIKISGQDYARIESINVSANGVYFSLPTYLPVLTKVEIGLSLPADNSESGFQESKMVTCEGVVVRIEPEQEQPGVSRYDVACYFTSIDEEDSEFLESYILKQVAF
jgi:c-di-GMP-binding flagellar brake protein YcgR